MNLETYRVLREKQRLAFQSQFRPLCFRCFQPGDHCYCPQVKSFDPHMTFAILMDGIEARRRIATGRMSHLALETSRLIRGQDFSQNASVNQLLEDPDSHPMILYPGPSSMNLSELTIAERARLLPQDKRLVVFVIDGTWNSARKMIRSRNLATLPRISFTPPRESTFRVRKQPAPGCLSTLEAIHHTIELLGPTQGFDLEARRHDHLFELFDAMVERQLNFVSEAHRVARRSRHTPKIKSSARPIKPASSRPADAEL